MIERFGISIFWLFLGCVNVLIVMADEVFRFLSWAGGEQHEEANRDDSTLECRAERDGGPVDSESNREVVGVNMNTKKWYKSKTIWGSIVAVLALIAGAFGYEVGPEAQEEITTAVLGIAGGAMAIYGRIKAVDKVE